MDLPEIKAFLEEKADQYNRPEFIDTDPVYVPHQYTRKEDIEISGFLTATIAWGQRYTILQNASKLMGRMDHAPYDFLMESDRPVEAICKGFIHRTFQPRDCSFFLASLKNIYQNHGGLEEVFTAAYQKAGDLRDAFSHFRSVFLETAHMKRSEKHVADIRAGASAKRLNMFLRWMVRKDNRGVDFGLWSKISPAALYMPLDVHTASVARKMGLLKRKSNDWQAVEELTGLMRSFDPADPVKFDFALFGLGIFERF